IDRADFAGRLADGVVEGLNAVFGADSSPLPARDPDFPPFATVTTLQEPRMVTVTVDALNARQWAELDQPVRAVWNRGRRFWVRGWVVGAKVAGNPVWWITGRGSRKD